MLDYLFSVPWYGLLFFIFCFVVILSSWLSLLIPDKKVEEYSSHNLDALRYGIMLKKKREKEKEKELTIEKHNNFMEFLEESKIKLNEAELNAYIKLVYNSNIFNKEKGE